jgi:death-on-curing protein
MKVINLEQLLEIHALLIRDTGGANGLRDLGRLESSLATQTQNVFGQELYESEIDKSAALIRSIIADHPFVDGNKRAAMLVGLTFLDINNIKVEISRGEIEDFAVKIAIDKLDITAISIWLSTKVI